MLFLAKGHAWNILMPYMHNVLGWDYETQKKWVHDNRFLLMGCVSGGRNILRGEAFCIGWARAARHTKSRVGPFNLPSASRTALRSPYILFLPQF
jgi:hypothetical protein